MCIICDSEKNNDDYKSLYGLWRIKIEVCDSVTSIPAIEGLQKLDIFDCKSITSVPVIEGLKKLCIWGCDSFTSVPVIEGLEELYIWSCNLITSVPIIGGLKKLCIWSCKSFTSVPVIEELKKLHIWGCDSITSVPVIEGLISVSECKWLEMDNDKRHSVLKLQQRMKQKARLKMFKKYVRSRQFCEWFYSPDEFGGQASKRSIGSFIQKVVEEQKDSKRQKV